MRNFTFTRMLYSSLWGGGMAALLLLNGTAKAATDVENNRLNRQQQSTSQQSITIVSELSSGSDFEITLKYRSENSSPFIDLNGNKVEDEGEALALQEGEESLSLTWGSQKEVKIYADKITELTLKEAKLQSIDTKNAPDLTSLDVSKNELTILDVSANTILDKLDCSDNPSLKTLKMPENNPLSNLFAEKCALEQIELNECSRLEYAVINNNKLTEVDFSKASSLLYVKISCNKIGASAMHKLIASLNDQQGEVEKSLIVINTDLGQKELESNVCLKEDIAVAKSKHWMPLDDSTMEEYEGSENAPVVVEEFEKIALTPTATTPPTLKVNVYGEELWVDLNRDGSKDDDEKLTNGSQTFKCPSGLESFSICGSKITSLEINDCAIAALDLSKASSLQAIVSKKNSGLTSITLPSEKRALGKIDLSENKLSGALNLSDYEALSSIDLSGNELTELTLGEKPNLKHLNVTSNKLSTLDLMKTGVLENLSCEHNNISELLCTGATELKEIHAKENRLEELDLSYCNFLEIIDLEANSLKSITFPNESSHTKVVKLGHNKLTEVDLIAFSEAVEIDVTNNNLKTVTIPTNKELSQLSLSKNNLSHLNLSGVPNLKHLYISRNQFSHLNVSSLKKLVTLSIYGNQFSGDLMTQLVRDLPQADEPSMLSDRVLIAVFAKEDGTIEDTNRITTQDVIAAKERKWETCAMSAEGKAIPYAGEPTALDEIGQQRGKTASFENGWILSWEDDQLHTVEVYNLQGELLLKKQGSREITLTIPLKKVFVVTDNAKAATALIR